MSDRLHRQRSEYAIIPAQAAKLKIRMLDWAQQFSIHLFLDNNQYQSPYKGYECLLAAGAVTGADIAAIGSLQALYNGYQQRHDWLFGHIAYDYEDVLHPVLSAVPTGSGSFPLFYFFVPETVCYINRDLTLLTIESFSDPGVIYDAICRVNFVEQAIPSLSFIRETSKETYKSNVDALRNHIADGDCYEVNYCTRGSCDGAVIDPPTVFHALNRLSPAPFAAYYKWGNNYMMCASPERYLRKEGTTLTAQPIKGTARRGTDEANDEALKEELFNSIKERAENVMIVDLMRNDLARSCTVGSVQVRELFGIYTFAHVHQMISTISGTIKEDIPFTDAIKYSFPMGSMTGAPKHKVMQLIDRYEDSKRGLFSGTVGYITPDGDFDFNVIIRSLFYDSSTKHLHYETGGAITYDSDPELEWEEMRLKAWALERIFTR